MSTSEPLEDRILDSLVKSEFPPGWMQEYMPEGSLQGLISKQSVIREFSRYGSFSGRRRANRDLLEFILERAKTVFAISLFAGVNSNQLKRAMMVFKSNSFDDSRLLRESPDPRDPQKLPWSELNWTMVKLLNFSDTRWKFLVPVFQEDKIKYELESRSILPFTLAKEGCKQGAFSNVWKISIHESHLKEPMQKVRNTRDGLRRKWYFLTFYSMMEATRMQRLKK